MPEIKKPKIQVSPLSINQAWQGRRFKTKNYEQYTRDVLLQLPKQEKVKGWVEVHLRFYIKNFSLRDTDNMIKPILDILTKKGSYEDDRKIVRIVAEKVKSIVEGFDFEIIKLNDQ